MAAIWHNHDGMLRSAEDVAEHTLKTMHISSDTIKKDEFTFPKSTIKARWTLQERIGSGGFGSIFKAFDNEKQIHVAVKVEKKQGKCYLEKEVQFYSSLERSRVHGATRAAPKCHYTGVECGFKIAVFDLMGESLSDLFYICERKFSLKCVLMLAIQLITRLEAVHDAGIVHRDVKPGNFVMGRGEEAGTVFAIDFGLSNYWRGSNNKHITFNTESPFRGTHRYASINSHMKYEQSRRDDMEALGYVLIYFLKGGLPWQSLKVARNKRRKAIGRCKAGIPPEQLTHGLPEQFAYYLQHVRSLQFDARPDYNYYRELFQSALDQHKLVNDGLFDWILRAQQPCIIPSPSLIFKSSALFANPLSTHSHLVSSAMAHHPTPSMNMATVSPAMLQTNSDFSTCSANLHNSHASHMRPSFDLPPRTRVAMVNGAMNVPRRECPAFDFGIDLTGTSPPMAAGPRSSSPSLSTSPTQQPQFLNCAQLTHTTYPVHSNNCCNHSNQAVCRVSAQHYPTMHPDANTMHHSHNSMGSRTSKAQCQTSIPLRSSGIVIDLSNSAHSTIPNMFAFNSMPSTIASPVDFFGARPHSPSQFCTNAGTSTTNWNPFPCIQAHSSVSSLYNSPSFADSTGSSSILLSSSSSTVAPSPNRSPQPYIGTHSVPSDCDEETLFNPQLQSTTIRSSSPSPSTSSPETPPDMTPFMNPKADVSSCGAHDPTQDSIFSSLDEALVNAFPPQERRKRKQSTLPAASNPPADILPESNPKRRSPRIQERTENRSSK